VLKGVLCCLAKKGGANCAIGISSLGEHVFKEAAMRSCSLLKLWAVGAAAVTVMAAIASSSAPASAQTMGEYATTLGQSASFGESIAPSLPPPAAYSNTVGDANSTTTIEVTGDDRDGLDGSEGARAARCTRQRRRRQQCRQLVRCPPACQNADTGHSRAR
jgi:hypothetical protein